MTGQRIRHCRQACEAHGFWCVTEGTVHVRHQTDLCGCVWDFAGNTVVDLDAVIEANERRFPTTAATEAVETEHNDAKESHDHHGGTPDDPESPPGAHRAGADHPGAGTN